MKAGTRLKSAVCDTEVMLIKVTEGEIQCGGAVMSEDNPAAGELDAAFANGSQMGKRYVNEAGTLELLCVKPGNGSLALDGVALNIKDAKPLPSSD